MALLTKEITIKDGNDKGKTFVVSQMPLLKGDRWANRVALALMKSGVDVSSIKGFEGAAKGEFVGMLDLASVINLVLKALGGIEEQVAQDLLDELLSVIKLKLDDGNVRSIVPPSENSNGDIGSIDTLWKLRIEAIKVNFDFLLAGVIQK